MECSIGEFLIEGAPLAALLEPAPPDEAAVGRLQASYRVGRQRTIDQDAAFGVRQIVDIALKALSPGINDTTTAVMCLDYLTAILSRLSARRIPQHARGEDGELRVLARSPTFDGLVREAFDQIRESAAGNTVALERMIRSLDLLTERNAAPERRRALLRQVQALTDMTRRSVEYAVDRQRLEQLAAGLTDRLIRPADKPASSAG